MLFNYLKLAWRNIRNNKLFSAINILGLAIGLACCILMFLFIQHETSYDKFNAKANETYRVTSESKGPAGLAKLAVTPAPWAPLMKKDYPEIQNYARILKDERSVVGQPDGQQFYESDLLYVDSTFFDVFSFNLERGQKINALTAPNSIVLTSSAAKKYFGDADPIGKTLSVNSFGRTFTVQVTAISENAPSNSHFNFNALVSLKVFGDLSELWSFHMFQTYLVVNSQVSKDRLEEKFKGFNQKYLANNPQADGMHDILLQPLTSIHLNSQMTGELGINGEITYVYIFTGVALFILLIACFNFTNLSTAKAVTRAKEVGLRKVAGAYRAQLITQFLGEAILIAFISLILSIVITALALPLFNQLSGRELVLDLFKNRQLTILISALIIFVGIISGIYPALVLSAFKPIEVLKGKFLKSSKGISFRKGLVTLQFVVSMILIASTILVGKQLRYMQNKKLGFDKENVAIISLPRDSDSLRLQQLRNSLVQEKVTSAAASSVPGTNIPVNLVNDGNADLTKAISMQMLFTDPMFLKTMNMKLVAGRDFSETQQSDKDQGFILNQEAVKKMGWKNPSDAIGKTFQWVQPNVVLKSGRVIGVVEDFHITPLKSAVQPLVIHYLPRRFQYLYVKFQQSNSSMMIASIEKKFKALFPKQSFEYSFLDDKLNNLYASERKLGSIFTWFSMLAIIIACMGILGLSLYSIQQKMKEIGIRKVLGATVAGISIKLLKEFLKPVAIAAILATPIAWYGMNKWLENFAYRIEINGWVFALTTFIVLVIAILTMCVQSIKAALSNPVDTLRSE